MSDFGNGVSHTVIVTDIDAVPGLDSRATVSVSPDDAERLVGFANLVRTHGYRESIRSEYRRLLGLDDHECLPPAGALVLMSDIRDKGVELGYDRTGQLTKPLLAIARFAESLTATTCDTVGVYCLEQKHHLHLRCKDAWVGEGGMNRILVDIGSLKRALANPSFIGQVRNLGVLGTSALLGTAHHLESE